MEKENAFDLLKEELENDDVSIYKLILYIDSN
jgi:hypothetical protein